MNFHNCSQPIEKTGPANSSCSRLGEPYHGNVMPDCPISDTMFNNPEAKGQGVYSRILMVQRTGKANSKLGRLSVPFRPSKNIHLLLLFELSHFYQFESKRFPRLLRLVLVFDRKHLHKLVHVYYGIFRSWPCLPLTRLKIPKCMRRFNPMIHQV